LDEVGGLLKSLKKKDGNMLGETETHKSQNSDRVAYAIVAASSIVHCNRTRSSLLTQGVTKKLFIEAGVDSFVVLTATMLFGGHGRGRFRMSEKSAAKHLVLDLELRGHQLDQAHLGHPKLIWLFQDFDVRNGAPGLRGEPHQERHVAKEGIDVVKVRVQTRCFVV